MIGWMLCPGIRKFARQSKASICRPFLSGIAVSSPAGGVDISFLRVFCVIAGEGLCDGPIIRLREFLASVGHCVSSHATVNLYAYND